MANGPMPRALLCALLSLCAACSSDASNTSFSAAGESSAGVGAAGANSVAGASVAGGGGAGTPSGSTVARAGGDGNSSADEAAVPPAVDGRSVYALECHGDSKDCNLGAVPCFGVSSQTPNVAAGWACANRCASNADCSSAPSGAEAQASCVSFTSASHCMLVCQNENQSFACPAGMSCYVPPKSAIGYCLWQ